MFDSIKQFMHAKRQAREAAAEAQHAENQAARKAAQDPAYVAKARAYFDTLDDSHKVAFINSNHWLESAFVVADHGFNAEVNRLFAGNGGQTADGKPLDLSVVEPVYHGQ